MGEIKGFSALVPKGNIDDISGYKEAMDYAFSNPDIRNVALSGSYGSGKSSVIRSYENIHKERKYIHISLASFEEQGAEKMDSTSEKQAPESKPQEDDETGTSKIKLILPSPPEEHGQRQTVNELEGKILNQLLHQIPTKDIPQSCFNLLERGLSPERIRRNQYRSMPETEQGRRLIASLLQACGHDLMGLPGFRTYYGDWTLSGPSGFLIPVRDKDGLIQGLKVRLDDADDPGRKYRWLSSRGLPGGTRSYSWVHVTGDTTKKRAFLTEGPLKGDVASFLGNDALFVCIGGVNAIHGLKETLLSLGITEAVEAMDMDQMTNPHVRDAVRTIRREVQSIPGIKYSKYTWDPAYKGVDDYLLSRVAAM